MRDYNFKHKGICLNMTVPFICTSLLKQTPKEKHPLLPYHIDQKGFDWLIDNDMHMKKRSDWLTYMVLWGS